MKRIFNLYLLSSLILIGFNACQNKPSQNNTGNIKKPGPTAELFDQNRINTEMNERDAALSPDGKEFYFTIQLNPEISVIAHSYRKNSQWSKPEIVEFSGKYRDLEPVFHPDGKRLFFVSNRPLKQEGEPKDFDIWYVERETDGWSKPVHTGNKLNSTANEFYPSFTQDGTIYFCSIKEESIGGEDIFYSKVENGEFQSPRNMGDSINSKGNEYNAFISPQGDFIMYNTHVPGQGYGSGDIYIAFKDSTGTWRKPVNMGNKINSKYFEYSPSLSSDGKYLFFTSHRINLDGIIKPFSYDNLKQKVSSFQNGTGDIYWISSDIIEELRKRK